jgi:hypothetical protein
MRPLKTKEMAVLENRYAISNITEKLSRFLYHIVKDGRDFK